VASIISTGSSFQPIAALIVVVCGQAGVATFGPFRLGASLVPRH
jgi:hypothetical protein